MCLPNECLAIGLRDMPTRRGDVTVQRTAAANRQELISQDGDTSQQPLFAFP